MKKLLGMLSALIVAALIVGCASTKSVSKVEVTSEQDSDGKLVITNTSGQEIVLFVNGIARKRIRKLYIAVSELLLMILMLRIVIDVL